MELLQQANLAQGFPINLARGFLRTVLQSENLPSQDSFLSYLLFQVSALHCGEEAIPVYYHFHPYIFHMFPSNKSLAYLTPS